MSGKNAKQYFFCKNKSIHLMKGRLLEQENSIRKGIRTFIKNSRFLLIIQYRIFKKKIEIRNKYYFHIRGK